MSLSILKQNPQQFVDVTSRRFCRRSGPVLVTGVAPLNLLSLHTRDPYFPSSHVAGRHATTSSSLRVVGLVLSWSARARLVDYSPRTRTVHNVS